MSSDGRQGGYLVKALADRIAKFEETDRVAYEIIDAEATAREKKTEKLRALRLAREQSGKATAE